MRNVKRYPREPRFRLRFLPREVGNNPSYRGGDWEKQRQLALQRAGNRCEGCGRPAGVVKLAVHHIMGYAYGGTNDLSNLKVLCAGGDQADCHPALESYGGGRRRGEAE